MEADLRSFLNDLNEKGELLQVGEEVRPHFEITAVLKEVLGEQGGPAVLFENVGGYPGKKVVGNLLASRHKLALALGCAVTELRDVYLQKRAAALAPEMVKGAAPCQEEIISGEPDLPALLPVPLFHQGDAGPYLTAGVLIARDPISGKLNSGIHRLQLKGTNRLGVFLANPPLSDYFHRAEQQGKPLPAAVALGLHPAELLAAAVTIKQGLNSKLELAGALAGRPVPLVPARSVDLPVPALAEIILEGEILPGVREKEGPFGESSGYYFAAQSPVMEIRAVTFRREPILSVIPPWGIETDIILSAFSGAELWQELNKLVPEVLDVAFLPGSLTFQGVIQVAPTLSRREVRRLIHLALNLDRRLKHVVVVDEDVDIHSPREVLWALATRFQGAEDLLCLHGLEGYVIDPSVKEGETAKLGFDATARPGGPAGERFRRLTLPRTATARAKEILQRRQQQP
ncbi:MAG: UbiD family decarboxylase [Bacillota bacterium]